MDYIDKLAQRKNGIKWVEWDAIERFGKYLDKQMKEELEQEPEGN